MKTTKTPGQTQAASGLSLFFAVFFLLFVNSAWSQSFTGNSGFGANTNVENRRANRVPATYVPAVHALEKQAVPATYAPTTVQPQLSMALPDWYVSNRTATSRVATTGVRTPRLIVSQQPTVILRDLSPPPPPRYGFLFVVKSKH